MGKHHVPPKSMSSLLLAESRLTNAINEARKAGPLLLVGDYKAPTFYDAVNTLIQVRDRLSAHLNNVRNSRNDL